ncbi:MAG: outer membrane lipoprotein-sorting protein [Gammaproteobacteria bacterium]|nr:outer membrane lipoprotein-sorting protein [Gammaproteobacteria bacterium]
MMRNWMLTTTAAAVLAAGVASAAAPALPLEQILARNAAARGGTEAWRKVTSLEMSGKMDANKPMSSRPDYHPPAQAAHPRAAAGAAAAGAGTGAADDPNRVIELPFRLQMMRPRKTRLEIDFHGATAVQIYDGTQGVKIRPFLGRTTPEPYTRAELELAAQEQELDGPLIDHARKGTQIALDGVESVHGRDAYKLRLTLRGGAVRHVWVDAASFLDVQIDGARTLDGKPHAEATYLTDYRAVDGLMVPMRAETSIAGVPGATALVIDRVTVNPRIDAARFRVAAPAVAATTAPGLH